MIHYRGGNLQIKEKQRIHIIPIGDCQSESQLYRLEGVVDWGKQQLNKGNLVYFVMLGDYFECTSPSERVKLAGSDLHLPTYQELNKAYVQKANDFINILKPLKGHFWTVLTGHHMAMLKIKKDSQLIRSDQYIAEALGTQYSGDGVATVYVNINGMAFKIMSHHGFGAAKSIGGQLNKRILMRETIMDCHVFLMGHDNVKAVVEKKPFLLTPEGCREFKQYFCGIGALQESYEDGLEAGFAEKFLMAPAALGFIRITVQLEKHEGKWRLDYHVRS